MALVSCGAAHPGLSTAGMFHIFIHVVFSLPRQLALVSAAPGEGDDPGRNPSSIVQSFDLFAEELAKSAKAFFPNAVRESTPPRSRPPCGGGAGSGGNDPDGPNGRDNNYNNRSPPRPFPGRPGWWWWRWRQSWRKRSRKRT
eukprot:1806874-Amphidinium_carterae.4